MAFILPLAILGGGSVGFVAGYIYNTDTNINSDISKIDINNITAKDLMKLKEQSPHKEIHNELVKFDKEKLKKVDSVENMVKNNVEQELIEKLREKILSRRYSIDTEHLYLPVIEDM